MRIAFITDIHIGAVGEKPQGVDVRENFLKALAFLPEIKPACLVIGGDLCLETADRATYEWIKQQLDNLPYPYRVIAGNHDSSALIAEVFNLDHHLHGTELYYALPLEGRPALFLDSASGAFSPTQWQWLRDYIDALQGNNLLIFMHHPPLPADVTYMDTNYPFRQSEQFMDIVRDLACHVTVVCGHYHVEKAVQRGNLLALLTPSTFLQMKHDPDTMVVDNYYVGVREINLTSHGVTSTVHYLGL
ncbi:metallophosphoesterase family protein [Spirosoma utsteinense]|uniref:Icc protein n=1 Tax=Spirosoma utsteinense TaxID=2585773 RepID=A0ABR6W050_9BACT|nr:metallophosphoesterase [Spirosoma utsteinense]MBC3786604.1 Icc protein [Spirosoma utsteinense]MBC3789982.1 Icc protein [Spirosoma utsteinense]